jgi:truncated hemoglobin YjbI
MDLAKMIDELRREKEKLDRAISSVETLQADGDVPVRKRRGRKSMSPEERREVSARMRKYWTTRLAKR